MKKRKHIRMKCFFHHCIGFLLCIIMILLTGCPQPVDDSEQKEKVAISQSENDGKNNEDGTQSNNDTVSGEITHIGLPMPKSLSKIQIPLKITSSVLSDTENEKKVKYEIEAALYENFLLNPEKAAVLYPGAVLAGDSIDDGTYREISQGKKRSALFSFSLQGVKDKGGKPGKVSDSFAANLSRYRDFHNQILSQKINYAASMSSSYNEFAITSEEDFNVKCQLGVGFGSSMLKTQLSDGISFDSKNNKKHHLIRFVETFYTVDMDSGNKPFMTDIPKKALGSTMPVYVSSVTYGRVAYLLIETEKNWLDIQPALDLALKVKKDSVDAEVNAAIKKLENTAKTTIFTIGGGNNTPTTLSEFSKSIAKGGFSSGNPGQVIKYKLKFLGDNRFAYIRYGGSYTVTKKKQSAPDDATSSENEGISGEITYAGLPIPDSLSKIQIPLKTTASVLSDTENEKKVKYDIEAALYENFLLNPEKAAVLYPGAVLVGDSIDDGTYREIAQGNKRSALFSFSLQGVKGKGGKPGKVSDSFAANLSRYRDFHNEVLSQKIDYTASMSSSYDEFSITSEDDFDVKCKLGVGFGISKLKAKLSAGLSFAAGEEKYFHLIRFVETFYTVDMDPGSQPLMTDIPHSILGATMPVYVSSVTYGRIAYLLIETEKTWEEIKPSFDMALKVKKQGVDAEVSAAIKKLEEVTKTTIFTIGCGENSPTKLSEFSKSIAKGGFSSGNPGQVIKYKLKFLDDDGFAYIRYAGTYTVTEKKSTTPENGSGGNGGAGESGSSDNTTPESGSTETSGKKVQITAKLKLINAKLNGFGSTANIFGTVDMHSVSDSNQQTQLFNYTVENQMAVSLSGETPLPASAVFLIVPDKSQELSFNFTIKRAVSSFLHYLFITSPAGGDNPPITCTVSDLENEKTHRFKLYQKNDLSQYLEFEIEFTVKKVD